MYKLCIFDLDGTLVDSHRDLANATNHALSKHGLPVHGYNAYKTFVGDGVAMLVRRAIGEEKFTDELGKAVLADFNDYYAAHLTVETAPYPGMCGAVASLREKGVRCAVFTNKPDTFAKIVARTLFPENSFEFIIGNAPGYPRKPDGTALRVMLSALDLPSENCLYIGDSDVDVLTGHDAELTVLGVTWGFRGREELKKAGADRIADTAEELLSVALEGEADA